MLGNTLHALIFSSGTRSQTFVLLLNLSPLSREHHTQALVLSFVVASTELQMWATVWTVKLHTPCAMYMHIQQNMLMGYFISIYFMEMMKY